MGVTHTEKRFCAVRRRASAKPEVDFPQRHRASATAFSLVCFLSLLLVVHTRSQSQCILQQSGTSASLRGVWFVDSLKGWVCGDSGIILHTSNGGQQ